MVEKFGLEELKTSYRMMLLIRNFEEKCVQLYKKGHIAGFCHLYSGQEAIVVAMQNSKNDKDSTITSYRDHGHMLACGVDPEIVFAELLGRSTGCSKGKGGSMHMFSAENGFYGGHGIVGAQVSIGTGLAFAHKYRANNGVCIVYFGDGAANQGQVYESFNMAKLWNLPVVYVIEDNRYALGTSKHRATTGINFLKRGYVFDIEGERVDGMNYIDMRIASSWAISYARNKGPVILHVDTYRYYGHSISDPATYRSKQEVLDIQNKRDSIQFLKNYLIENYQVYDSYFKNIESEILDEINKAADAAINAPYPDPNPKTGDLMKDIVCLNSAIDLR